MAQAATQPVSEHAEKAGNASVVSLRPGQVASTGQISRPKSAVNNTLIERLFLMEGRMREVENLQALKYFAVNEFRQIILSSQVMIFTRKAAQRPWTVEAVSALAAPDARSPILQWLCEELRAKTEADKSDSPLLMRLDITQAPAAAGHFQYALFAFVPVQEEQQHIAILFFADKPFTAQHVNILERLSKSLGHAWRVFDKGKTSLLLRVPRPIKWIIASALLLLMFVPLPLTVLAPAQIIAHEPQIISAPLSGVIREIFVNPNQQVKKGTLLYSFDKTEAQNSLDQASRKLLVAQSRHKRANQAAFGQGSLKSEMAIAKAEADLALSEQASYQRRLVLADVYAPSDGVVLFESVENWIGRPVETGERVMQIADPADVSLRIDLATEDAIVLEKNARAKVFLDANPLDPVEAKIFRTSYDVAKSDRDTLVFPIHAKLVEKDIDQAGNLRIGLRGTAQLFGEKVPMWFFLFRKPLSYIRQVTGF